MAKKYEKGYKFDGTTYDWAGTSITGTSTTAKKFPKSGLPSVKKDDTYLNTEKGHVYKCDTAGAATDAKWKYVETVVVGNPTVGVESLALKRGDGNLVMTASWKLPAAFSKSDSGTRAQHIMVKWILDTSAKGKANVVDKESKKAVATSDSENLANMYLGNGTSGKHYTRSDFYPHPGKPKLNAVSARVTPTNSRGTPGVNVKEADKKTTVSQLKTFEFEKPSKPTFSGWSFDAETGVASGTVTLDEGDGKKERRWTSWEVVVTDTSKAKSSRTDVKSSDDDDTRTSIPVSFNVSNYQSLTSTQYVRVRVKATAKGYAGDSDMLDKSCYVSFPKEVTINSVKATSEGANGRVVAEVDVESSEQFPVDRVKLQKLVDVDYAEASEIPSNADWQDTGAMDDAKCTALVVTAGEVLPTRGKHSWLRVKAWHLDEDALCSYSAPAEITDFYQEAASAADNECTIAAAKQADGGADVLVAWDLKSTGSDDDTTGMELSWSDDPDAWRSVDGPESYEFDWKDATADSRASETWNNTANVKVTGLDDGTTYYFRARCIGEHEGAVTKGDWCNPYKFDAASVPASAVLAASSVSPTGAGIAFAWALSSDAPQTAWKIARQTGTTTIGSGNNAAEVPTYAIVWEGAGGDTGCTVPWERVEPNVVNGDLTVCAILTAGEDVTSDYVTVRIVEPPTLEVTASTLAAQPFSFGVSSDTQLDEVRYTVTDSDGNSVATGSAQPALALSSGTWSGTVTLDGNREFDDGSDYTLTATAVSGDGLESQPAEDTFSVNWSHKAPMPSDAIEIVPEIIEHDGYPPTRQCTVTLTAPASYAATDVYDVYRLTHDGLDLVSPGKGFSMGYTFVDEHAPYGDAGDYGYRIACRTADGDSKWLDFGYQLDGDVLRFDFGGQAVELPHGIAISDKYAKDAKTRMHWSGDNEAYFNPGTLRKADLSSQVIRIEDAATAAAVRALAQHPGTAFVRTPDGSAYEAHVNVSPMDVGHGVIAASFDVEQLATSAAFKLPIPLEGETTTTT